MKKYAIGDIHGCNKTFQALLETIKFSKDDELYLLGDYIDRGPDSKGVIDTIFNLRRKGHTVQCIKGNHEQMLIDAYKYREEKLNFLRNGGITTLKSFDCDAITDIDDAYMDFFGNLPYYLEVDNYILVHGGLNFEKKKPLLDTDSMLWMRQWYAKVNYDWLAGRIILHGHTPLEKMRVVDLYENISENQYLNLDTGCVFPHYTDKGYLTAFEMTAQHIYFQPCIDTVIH
jgi:serine/threonine protein phosphatase 1